MTDKTQEIVESLKGAVSRCSATGRVLVNATLCDPDTIRELLDERDALLDALRQIAEWPDGGNRYGQGKIKRFAQRAIDALSERLRREAAKESK